ncbi:MAG: ABC transporter ATP-binding protein [Bacillota bacterium]|nr:ABC transporter ATP-binding protein [Bacillota bacterium]
MLQCHNISKRYAHYHVFDQIDLHIQSRTFIALTGPNGSGKSTLLRILGGYTSYSGTIRLAEVSMDSDYEKYMAQASYISNTSFLYDYLSPTEVFDLLGELASSKPDAMEALIASVHLTRFMHTPICQLSLGTKQKVNLIAGLFGNPRLLLMDEPFVNLDMVSRKALIRYFHDYAEKRDAIVIFAVHQPEESKALEGYMTHTLELLSEKEVRLCEIR